MRRAGGMAAALGVALLLTLGGCAERRSQELDHAAKGPDAQPWVVSDKSVPAYKAPGWTGGDKTSWEQQLRKRNQAQNDYVR